MLSNQKFTFTADTVVDDKIVASYIGVIKTEANDVSFAHRYIDKEACKIHRDIVRADQAEFEDMVYQIQESNNA